MFACGADGVIQLQQYTGAHATKVSHRHRDHAPAGPLTGCLHGTIVGQTGRSQAWTGHCAIVPWHRRPFDEHRRPLAPSKFFDVCVTEKIITFT